MCGESDTCQVGGRHWSKRDKERKEGRKEGRKEVPRSQVNVRFGGVEWCGVVWCPSSL